MEHFGIEIVFEEQKIRKAFGDGLKKVNDDQVFEDASASENNAVDPLVINIIIGIVASEVVKTIVSESIKLLFDKMKQIFSEEAEHDKEIKAVVKIKGKKIRLTYNPLTKKTKSEELN